MRTFHWRTTALTGTVLAGITALPAPADEITRIITQNTQGFTLPGVSLPSGHDEVRAADGTSCRSAVASSGAYVDVGIISDPNAMRDNTAAYGRVVVPLGRERKRINCTELYKLEVQRLRMELKMMEMGLGAGLDVVGTSDTTEFSDAGWTNDGQ